MVVTGIIIGWLALTMRWHWGEAQNQLDPFKWQRRSYDPL